MASQEMPHPLRIHTAGSLERRSRPAKGHPILGSFLNTRFWALGRQILYLGLANNKDKVVQVKVSQHRRMGQRRLGWEDVGSCALDSKMDTVVKL